MKLKQNIFHVLEKNGKRKQVTMHVKIIVSAKKIIFGILAQVFVKIVSI